MSKTLEVFIVSEDVLKLIPKKKKKKLGNQYHV